jgi:RNA polymerase sigma factor (sigma-70 family)
MPASLSDVCEYHEWSHAPVTTALVSQTPRAVRVMSMERIQAPSFRTFARAAYPDLVRFASALIGDLDTGRDIAQEAMERLWHNWDSVRLHDSPDHWLRRVAFNLAIDRSRRQAMERRNLPAVATPEAVVVEWPAPDPALWRAVRRLPERRRVAVVLRILEDRSHTEIAGVLGCSQANARQLLRRGLAQLRASLQDELCEVPR